MLINISHEDVIDWIPYNFPREKYSLSELRWQPYSLNETVAISSTVVDEPIQWHGVGGQVLCCSLAIQFRLICENWQAPYTLLKYGRES